MKMVKEMNFFIQTNSVGYKDYLKPSGIMDILQDIAGVHANELGIGFNDLLKKNLIWVVLYTKIDIYDELPKFSDNVLVKTYPIPPTLLEHNREYMMYKDNKLILTGISKWILLDSVSHKIKRASEISVEGEYYSDIIYTEKLQRRLYLNKELAIKEIEYKIRLSDLDHNGHMNNARYFDIIYEMDISNKEKIKSIEISFISEAHYNDIIHLYAYTDEKYDYYIGYINDEVSFEAKFLRGE